MMQFQSPDADGMVTLQSGRPSVLKTGLPLLLFAGVWNAITLGLIIGFSRAGKITGWMYLFFVPFVLVGLGTLIGGLYALTSAVLARAKVAEPVVRVSRQPLRLGESFRVLVSQYVKSPVRVTALRVRLQAREWVQYRRGTRDYTDKHTIHEQQATIVENVDARPAQPLTGQCQFTIPIDSMHSFQAPDNRIEWHLEVRTEIPQWPDYCAQYPLVVIPRLVPVGGDTS